MTSDSDDLEQQLRENLKLRRDLAAEVAKAKNGANRGGGIAYRSGWVIYWTCLALAGTWVAFWLLLSREESTRSEFASDPSMYLVVGFPMLVAYGLGRAFRYILSGR